MRNLPIVGSQEPEDSREEWQASLLTPMLRRRDFLRLMGASLSLMGLTGCAIRQPEEKILPYTDQPDGMTPGRPLTFATAMPRPEDGFGIGVLVTSREGRPIKVDGNPDHPASRGRSDIFLQASLLSLYDPDRSQTVHNLGSPTTLDAFRLTIAPLLEAQMPSGGAGMRFLCCPTTSPTVADQIVALQRRYPNARWHVYTPDDPFYHVRQPQLVYHFDHARRILALDSDFLRDLPGSIRYAFDFAGRRRIRAGMIDRIRLYTVEPTPTLTGAMADHRWRLAASNIGQFADAIAGHLGIAGTGSGGLPSGISADEIAAIAGDLRAAGSEALVIVGKGQPPAVQARVQAINDLLRSDAITFVDSLSALPADTGGLAALVDDMRAGRVQTLFLIGVNPLYDAPVDLGFGDALRGVSLTVHYGTHYDETAAVCTWHVPATHYLETWGDVRAHEGTVTICQPLIAPLFNGVSVPEFLQLLIPTAAISSGHDLVRAYWQRRWTAERLTHSWPADFETFWQSALKAGMVAGTAAPARTPLAGTLPAVIPPLPVPEQASGREIIFRADPTIGYGHWANNAWLQELPDPLTGIVWDNAILVSPHDASSLHLENGDVVELEYLGRKIYGPVWLQQGQADDCITVWLGQGRGRAGSVGNGVGYDVYPLRTSASPHFAGGGMLRKTGRKYPLVTTQEEQSMHGRDLIRTATLEHFREKPGFVHDSEDDGISENNPSLLPEYRYTGHAWGMVVDLNVCIGCHTCTIACQAENNIPVVGKEECGRGRIMHWIRVDRYFEGEADAGKEILFQPVPCMHCEKAPCELVCPVEATVHDDEGINNMVYNRCVGTRYCSNNCPYKVRRFNFLQYSIKTPIAQLMRNPEVTVRNRGVMEKCTYCIQRIKNAEIDAGREGDRPIPDGAIRTACQQACPTDAIVFGDINDPTSAVRMLKAQPHNYSLLSDLNTQPRTTYLARVSHPNPALYRTEGTR